MKSASVNRSLFDHLSYRPIPESEKRTQENNQISMEFLGWAVGERARERNKNTNNACPPEKKNNNTSNREKIV